jgi:hypothetical protein
VSAGLAPDVEEAQRRARLEARQVQQAIHLASRLVATMRHDPERAHAMTAGLDQHSARMVIATLAAMVPAGTDPRNALAWLDRPTSHVRRVL